MSKLLNDSLNLEILNNLISGTGVDVNISALSKRYKKHRNTIKALVNALFDYKIINKPIYPFVWLYQEYPLLVIVRADLPRNDDINNFLREDEHIFGAFYVRDEEYNTFLIEHHRDVYAYFQWRDRILIEKIIPPRDIRYPSNALFFSNRKIIKYQPHSAIYLMEEKYKKGENREINGYKMNHLCFQILKGLMLGEGIRTNVSLLAQKLNVNWKTIERRISALLDEKIISKPVCRFPKFIVPANKFLVYCLVEVKKSMDKIISAIQFEPCIPLALKAGMGRYNLLFFGVFLNLEDHFEWEERLDNRFPNCFGAMKKIYLTPKMTASIDQQKVSLGIIKQRKKLLHGRELIDSVSGRVQ